jgi:hypothetical protein
MDSTSLKNSYLHFVPRKVIGTITNSWRSCQRSGRTPLSTLMRRTLFIRWCMNGHAGGSLIRRPFMNARKSFSVCLLMEGMDQKISHSVGHCYHISMYHGSVVLQRIHMLLRGCRTRTMKVVAGGKLRNCGGVKESCTL